MNPVEQKAANSDKVPASDADTSAEGQEKKGVEESRWDNFQHSLDSLKQGEDDAWRDLMKILNVIADAIIAHRFSGGSNPINKHDAQDLAANVIIELRKTIGERKTLRELEAWFRKALTNDALDHRKRINAEKRGGGKVVSLDQSKQDKDQESDRKTREDYNFISHLHSLNDENYDWEIGRQTDPAAEAQREEVRKMLMDCVGQLPSAEQRFIECEMRGLKHHEIATECNCGTSEVGIRLARIHKKLAVKLKDFDLTEEEE